jgi:hypothetical protein
VQIVRGSVAQAIVAGRGETGDQRVRLDDLLHRVEDVHSLVGV